MDFLQREIHSNFSVFYAAKSLEFAADKITDLFKLLRNNRNLAEGRESRYFFFSDEYLPLYWFGSLLKDQKY